MRRYATVVPIGIITRILLLAVIQDVTRRRSCWCLHHIIDINLI